MVNILRSRFYKTGAAVGGGGGWMRCEYLTTILVFRQTKDTHDTYCSYETQGLTNALAPKGVLCSLCVMLAIFVSARAARREEEAAAASDIQLLDILW